MLHKLQIQQQHKTKDTWNVIKPTAKSIFAVFKLLPLVQAWNKMVYSTARSREI